jgi:tetratricopeptide (TPR) repeat protein
MRAAAASSWSTQRLSVAKPVRQVLGALLVTTLLLACQEGKEPLATSPRADLTEVPRPDLSAMEEVAGRALAEAREELDRKLAEGASGASLGDAFGELGVLYQAYGLRDAAVVAYRNALVVAPESFSWAYYLGIAEQQRGNLGAAATALSRALELRPGDGAARLGEVQLAQGSSDAAFDTFPQPMASPGAEAAAHYGRARALESLGREAEAVVELRKALDLQPRAGRVRHALGLALRRTAALDEAQEHLAEGGDGEVSYPDPLYREMVLRAEGPSAAVRLAVALAQDGHLEAAVDRYRLALKLDPDSQAARQGLASVLARQGDLEGAAREYRRALAGDPDSLETRLRLALVLEARGRSAPAAAAEAVAELRRVLAEDPGRKEARLPLVRALEAAGHQEEARRELEALLAADPTDSQALLHRATSVAREGRPQEALAGFRRVLELEPDNLAARLDLATALAASGELGAAEKELLETLRRPAAKAPERARAHLGLGAVYRRLGRLEEARDRYRKALEEDSELAVARYQLALLLADAGRHQEAAGELREVVRKQPGNGAARLAEARELMAARDFAGARQRLEEGVASLPGDGALAHLLARLLAGSPQAGLRDGPRAVTLAQAVFAAQRTLEHGETLAMALAEAGRFDEAVRLQEDLLAEARRREDWGSEERLQESLELYRQGRPPRSLRLGGA